MIAYFGAYFATTPVEHDEAGLLFRHMAVHTMASDGLSQRPVSFEFVATQTICRELCWGLLSDVNVVAG